ncbi:right-handed parallel beta-helix repeat-containing protein [Tistrella mobilis]|uniref:right-handed parallel beta-helix repeat-containing protein n=1 Tax=Tistrella mobilis TaxID=171437 RepID=UPI00355646EA
MAIFTYQTVAAMQQPPVGALPSPGDTAIVAGYHVYDDDGGGTFRLEAPTGPYVGAIDEGMVFDCVRSDTSTRIGVWRRIDQGPVRTAWYGIGNVRANGAATVTVSQTAAQIERAINAAGFGGVVVFSGTITLDRTVHIPTTTQLKGEGEGWDRPLIKAGENLKVMFTRASSTRIWVTGISFEGWIDGNAALPAGISTSVNGYGARTIGFLLYNANGRADLDSEFAFCRFYNLRVGIMAFGRNVLVTRTHFSSCRYGIVIQPAAESATFDVTIRGFNFFANRFHGCGGPREQIDVVKRTPITAADDGTAGFEPGDVVVYRPGGTSVGLQDSLTYVIGQDHVKDANGQDTERLKVYDRGFPGLYLPENYNPEKLPEAPDLSSEAWGAKEKPITPADDGGILDRTSTCIMVAGLADQLNGGLIADCYADDCRRFYKGPMGDMRITGVTGYRGYESLVETVFEGASSTSPKKPVNGAVTNCQWTCDFAGEARSGAAIIIRSAGVQIANNLISDTAAQGIQVRADHCLITGNVVRRSGTPQGITVSSKHCLIDGNLVESSTSDGLLVLDPTNNTVGTNRVTIV